jgi:hypothetical protein
MIQLKDKLIEQLNIEIDYYKNKLQNKNNMDNLIDNQEPDSKTKLHDN